MDSHELTYSMCRNRYLHCLPLEKDAIYRKAALNVQLLHYCLMRSDIFTVKTWLRWLANCAVTRDSWGKCIERVIRIDSHKTLNRIWNSSVHSQTNQIYYTSAPNKPCSYKMSIQSAKAGAFVAKAPCSNCLLLLFSLLCRAPYSQRFELF